MKIKSIALPGFPHLKVADFIQQEHPEQGTFIHVFFEDSTCTVTLKVDGWHLLDLSLVDSLVGFVTDSEFTENDESTLRAFAQLADTLTYSEKIALGKRFGINEWASLKPLAEMTPEEKAARIKEVEQKALRKLRRSMKEVEDE